jgi:hypothetical protein
MQHPPAEVQGFAVFRVDVVGRHEFKSHTLRVPIRLKGWAQRRMDRMGASLANVPPPEPATLQPDKEQ